MILSDARTTTTAGIRNKALKGEILRCAFLASVAFWLLHPFATNQQIGAGDALWYSNMLADFVLQWRAGVFPVFVGQTEFAFNGAVYPLRVAPLYQHLGGFLDLLTGHRLGFFTLQHLVVIVSGVTGICSSYACLVASEPDRRWTAAALALLYVSCPGVLGTIYTQDLYMTWVAMPYLPIVTYGIVRSYQQNDVASQILISAGLALLWLAHAPIAMWMTLITGAAQAWRLLRKDRNISSWKRAIIGACLFMLLGGYPFISVATLRSPGASSTVSEKFEHPELIVASIRDTFPAVLRPLSRGAAQLSDLQLGYGLWAVLVVFAASLLYLRKAELYIFALTVAAILILLLPVPILTAWLWMHTPQTVQRLTYYWPMHRLYLVLAAIITSAGQLALSGTHAKFPAYRRLLHLTLFLACAWSLWESRQFIAAGETRTATQETTALRHRPENLFLMNHAYGLFPKLPAYFSHGVMDPSAEVRLLDPQTMSPLSLPSPAEGKRGTLVGEVDANPGILNLAPTLRLEPGKRYKLNLHFGNLDYRGILQIVGPSFFREYALPRSGEQLAFGTGRESSNTLFLWTTSDVPEEITLRFIPTGPSAAPKDFANFADFLLSDADAENPPVHVQSLLPFKVTAKVDRPCLLETPRMAMPGYSARVNGKSTDLRTSPEGLVAVPLIMGESTVELSFQGPLLLRISYWLTLASWTVLLLGAFRLLLHRAMASLRMIRS